MRALQCLLCFLCQCCVSVCLCWLSCLLCIVCKCPVHFVCDLPSAGQTAVCIVCVACVFCVLSLLFSAVCFSVLLLSSLLSLAVTGLCCLSPASLLCGCCVCVLRVLWVFLLCSVPTSSVRSVYKPTHKTHARRRHTEPTDSGHRHTYTARFSTAPTPFRQHANGRHTTHAVIYQADIVCVV